MAFSKCCPFASQLPLWQSAVFSHLIPGLLRQMCCVSALKSCQARTSFSEWQRGEVQWLAMSPSPLAFPFTSCSLGQGSGTSPFRTDVRMSGIFAKGEIWSSLCHVHL